MRIIGFIRVQMSDGDLDRSETAAMLIIIGPFSKRRLLPPRTDILPQ